MNYFCTGYNVRCRATEHDLRGNSKKCRGFSKKQAGPTNSEGRYKTYQTSNL